MPRVACSYMAYWFVNICLPQPTKWNLKTQLLDVPDMKKKKVLLRIHPELHPSHLKASLD